MTDSKPIGTLVSIGGTMGRSEGVPGSLGAHRRRVEKPIGCAPKPDARKHWMAALASATSHCQTLSDLEILHPKSYIPSP